MATRYAASGSLPQSVASRVAVRAVDVRSVTASTTVTTADDVILGDASAGGVTVTLQGAAGRTGRRLWVKNVGASGTVTIAAAGADTIDGAATYALTVRYQALMLVNDGTTWRIF